MNEECCRISQPIIIGGTIGGAIGSISGLLRVYSDLCAEYQAGFSSMNKRKMLMLSATPLITTIKGTVVGGILTASLLGSIFVSYKAISAPFFLAEKFFHTKPTSPFHVEEIN